MNGRLQYHNVIMGEQMFASATAIHDFKRMPNHESGRLDLVRTIFTCKPPAEEARGVVTNLSISFCRHDEAFQTHFNARCCGRVLNSDKKMPSMKPELVLSSPVLSDTRPKMVWYPGNRLFPHRFTLIT